MIQLSGHQLAMTYNEGYPADDGGTTTATPSPQQMGLPVNLQCQLVLSLTCSALRISVQR